MEYIKINNFKLYTSKDYEGGGLTYGIPALSSKNIFPHIVNGDIFEICCGVGTMGFYLNSLNKCNSPLMDFTQVNLFGKKSFSDLLKEIHTNQKDKEVQLRSLIEGLKPLITDPGSILIKRSNYDCPFN
jgi:hypothetical protein